ncbi:MAG: hypothetical protein WBG20_08740, partial [Candidatus Deferrimicrobiaceae bacterium]
MSVRIFDIRVPLGFPEENLLARVLLIIGVPPDQVENFSVARRGIDARRKGAIRRVYTADVSLRSSSLEEAVCSRVASARPHRAAPDPFPGTPVRPPPVRPVVVG